MEQPSETEIAQDALPQRNPTRGALMLLVLALVQALSVGFCTWGISHLSDAEWMEILPAVCIIFPVLTNMAFALAIPLLWFPQPWLRFVLAAVVPLLLWCCFLVGFSLPPDMDMDRETCLEATSVLLLSVAGAAVPVCLVMWAFQWRIQTPKHVYPPAAIGIVDLLALTALGAGIFAFERQWGVFVEEAQDLRTAVIGTLFYGVLGVLLALMALLSIRIALAADRRPFRVTNLIGIALSFALVGGGWALLHVESDGVFASDSNVVLMWFVFSALSWSSAAVTSVVVCWWLRRYGFVLTNAAIERSGQRQPTSMDVG